MNGSGAQQAYESVFARSLDGILFSSPDGRILAANPAACAILRLHELAVTVAHDAHGEPRVATWTVPIAGG